MTRTMLAAVILRGFAYFWVALVAVAIVAGIAGLWIKGGFAHVIEVMSPFNVFNWFVTAILLVPAIAALSLAEKLKK